MLKKLSVFAFAFLLFSCGQKAKQTEEPVEAEVAVETAVVADGHAANTALDYAGTYKGVLPCADCEGIETVLTLDNENNYTLKTTYLGKDAAAVEKSGTYAWNKAGNTVILDGITDAPNQFFVGENQVFQLDKEGNRITGDLADKYILRKE